jgi:hypothetical protein
MRHRRHRQSLYGESVDTDDEYDEKEKPRPYMTVGEIIIYTLLLVLVLYLAALTT